MPFKKGQSGNPAGKPAGVKNGATLLREERRAQFDAWASENWQKIMAQLPPSYVADQFLGKAPDKVEMSSLSLNVSIVPEVLKIAEEEYKRRKLMPPVDNENK